MKKSLLLLPVSMFLLVGCNLPGKLPTSSSDIGTTSLPTSSSSAQTGNHAGTLADPFTPAEAIAKCDEAGSGNIYGSVEVFVRGTFDAGTEANSSYHQWYGTLSGTAFKVSGATNNTTTEVAETNGNMDGKEVIVRGFIELYNGEYKMGYLPANASPTGSKYVPAIVWLDGAGEDTSKTSSSQAAASSSSQSKSSTYTSYSARAASGEMAGANCAAEGSIPQEAQSIVLDFSTTDFAGMPNTGSEDSTKAKTGNVTVAGVTYDFVNCSFHPQDANSKGSYLAMYAKTAKAVASFANATAIPGTIVAVQLTPTTMTSVSPNAYVSCDLSATAFSGTTTATEGAIGLTAGTPVTAYAGEGSFSYFRISALKGISNSGSANWYNMMVGKIEVFYIAE